MNYREKQLAMEEEKKVKVQRYLELAAACHKTRATGRKKNDEILASDDPDEKMADQGMKLKRSIKELAVGTLVPLYQHPPLPRSPPQEAYKQVKQPQQLLPPSSLMRAVLMNEAETRPLGKTLCLAGHPDVWNAAAAPLNCDDDDSSVCSNTSSVFVSTMKCAPVALQQDIFALVNHCLD